MKKLTGWQLARIYHIIIFIILSIGILFIACSQEEPVEPIDPCSVFPEAPYGEPDNTSTWVSADYKAITYMYDCLDGEYVIVSYYTNINVKEDFHKNIRTDCWEEKETRAEGMCD